MSKRVFIPCTVLSISDTSILYPSCLKCFSRVEFKEQSSRWRCVKCGRDAQSAGRRYRLTLRVATDWDVLGVTLFGSCLDSFFGAPALQLYRFLNICKESRGAQIVDRLLRRALEDCFVGRCVRLEIKLPGNVEENVLPGQLRCPALAGSVKTSEQYIASHITLPNKGIFGATVIHYLQSLLLVCVPSDGCSLQEASQESLQDGYHDYTQLCHEEPCSHSGMTAPTNTSLPLQLQQSLGLSCGPVGSPERLLPGRLAETVCTSASDGHRTESGYSDTSREKAQTGSPFASFIGDEVLAGSFSQPVIQDEPLYESFLDELLANHFSRSLIPNKLLANCLSSSSAKLSESTPNQEHINSRVSSHQESSSKPAVSYDSQVACERNMAATPEHLVYDSDEGYNYSAELFDVSGLDRSDFDRSGQVSRRTLTSAAPCYLKTGLAPSSQSTPIFNRGAPERRQLYKATEHCREVAQSWLDGSWQTDPWETGSRVDRQIEGAIGDEGCCVTPLSAVPTGKEADWSKDLFVDSYKE